MAFTFSGPVPVPAEQSAVTVLITGASRGLGLELVRQYARAHVDNVVFAAVRSPEKASAGVLGTIVAAHPNVHIIPLDVADEESVRSSVIHVTRVTDHLDAVINNAAIVGEPAAGDALTATSAQLTAVFTTNVAGPLVVIQTFLPLLQRSTQSAKVLNVNSAAGSNSLAGRYGKPTLSYGVSKAALTFLNTAFRYSVPSVAFLTVSPGWMDTDMGNSRAKAPTSVSDVAQAIRYYLQVKGAANSGEYFDIMTGDSIPY